MDITIRNPQEFSNFLHQGGFHRQHMSSMLSQVFDPSFIFNAVYHNIARLINRRIVKSVWKPMPMTYKIRKDYFPLLEKLSQLFFQTETLQVQRYILLPNTKVKYIKKLSFGFLRWVPKFLNILNILGILWYKFKQMSYKPHKYHVKASRRHTN